MPFDSLPDLVEEFLQAAEAGNLVAIKECINRGVDTEAKNGNGWNALLFATYTGHLDIVHYLIETCHVDKDAKTNIGLVALHLASSNGRLEIVQYLIDTCHVDTEAKTVMGNTALHLATSNGHLEIVQNLIETCRVDKEAKDNDGWTALQWASRYGHLEIVHYLIETCHVDKNAEDNNGCTALHDASWEGHLEIVQYLIEKCHVNMVETDTNGCTALHFASYNGHLNVVQYLIETCHVDTNAKDIEGWTALHFATRSVDGHLDVVKYLIETWRLDPETIGHDGWTALHHASSNGHFDIVKYLVESCGVEKEEKDFDGLTYLHLAADGGYLEIVTYLIEDCKVNMWVRDNAGRTAYDLSLISGNDDVTNYFRQRLDKKRSDQSILSNINPDGLPLIPVNQPCFPLYTNGKVVPTRYSLDDDSDSMSRLEISSGQSSLFRNVVILSNPVISDHLSQCFDDLFSGEFTLSGYSSISGGKLTLTGNSANASMDAVLSTSSGRIRYSLPNSEPTNSGIESMHSNTAGKIIPTKNPTYTVASGQSITGISGSVLTSDIISMSPISDQATSTGKISLLLKPDITSDQTTSSGSISVLSKKSDRISINLTANQSTSSWSINALLKTDMVSVHSHLILAMNPNRADPKIENSHTERNVTPTMNPLNALPRIDDFLNEHPTSDELPWYAIVIGSQDNKTSRLKESLTYRCIRNRSKYIPLEILYYKLIQMFQQPEYIKAHQEVPSHEDQLLFVYAVDGVFRPIHWKEIDEPENSLSPRGKRDFLVAADIKSNGGRIQLSSEEKKEHLEILIRWRCRDLDSIVPELPYRQIVSRTLAAIEGVIADVAEDEDIAKHNAQILETWKLYFPTPEQNRKRKSVSSAIVGNLVTPTNPSNELPNIHNFLDEYTIKDLPWHAIVIGSNDKQYCGLRASPTYRRIRNRSKFIPLEILLFKLLQTLQQPEYIDNLDVVPTHEDQLLFVYVDKGVFRPSHRNEGMDDALSPREKRDFLVAADIKKNGGKLKLSELSVEDKKDHLGILIQFMRRVLDSMETKESYRQIVSGTLAAVEEVISGNVDDADIAKHETQIKNTWERYFPAVPKPNNKEAKLAISNNDNGRLSESIYKTPI